MTRIARAATAATEEGLTTTTLVTRTTINQRGTQIRTRRIMDENQEMATLSAVLPSDNPTLNMTGLTINSPSVPKVHLRRAFHLPSSTRHLTVPTEGRTSTHEDPNTTIRVPSIRRGNGMRKRSVDGAGIEAIRSARRRIIATY